MFLYLGDMARNSSSTYSKRSTTPEPNPTTGPFCSIHVTPLMDGDCWDCGGPAAGAADTLADVTDRALADSVRANLALAERTEPGIVTSFRQILNNARINGTLSRDLIEDVWRCLTISGSQAFTAPAAPATPADQIVFAPPKPSETPVTEVKGGTWTAVPDGYYATTSRTGSNDLDFWKVSTVKGGDWDGFRGVSRVIGGRADERVRGQERTHALRAIETMGAEAAGFLFASELGRCMRCNRTLTDENSRALGLGPECAQKEM